FGNYIGTDVTGTLDFGNGKQGILLKKGSSGNTIGVDAANLISGNNDDGVQLVSGSNANTVAGNRIGTNAAGTVALGNGGDGVEVKKSSGNTIGNTNAVSSQDFYNAADGTAITSPVSGWQGIRGSGTAGQYIMTGTSGSSGLVFIGSVDGSTGTTYYPVNYPTISTETTVYGPDVADNGDLRLVGTYRTSGSSVINGFLFEGTTADFANGANYTTINYPGAEYNYVHSTAGGLVVGNYDNPADHGTGNLPYGPGHAFIYDIATDTFLVDVVFPGSKSNSVYGIWYNGGTKYTLVGGYSNDFVNNFDDPEVPLESGYIVDYDTSTGTFSNWKSFNHPLGGDVVTHFEGISSVEKGVYTLAADAVDVGTGDSESGAIVTVRRNADGTFSDGVWVTLADPNAPGAILSSDSVYGNVAVGILVDGSTLESYQAVVNTEFQLSNVISGNAGNGINFHKATNNLVAMNCIGTNAAGTADLGNALNGIQLTKRSSHNLIGGEATGGNAPTEAVFVRPPQGNLISGNNQNGVLINGKSGGNQLSGNFIGTDGTGNAALGNALDGVLIEKADGNTLLGCTFEQNPFVFYNVLSGNGGNGLRVNNADDTTIQANFFGMGANNDTDVGNAGNGVVIQGNSTRTVMGGPIPMGNVVAANALNGIVVEDKASEFTTYNTFCGLAAFSDDPSFGNGQDGMLITTTGKNILIRTNVITRNGDDGIEVSGKAKGVRIAGNIIGLNTEGVLPMGNADNGIEIGGSAQNIVVGGPQPTFNVIPRNAIAHNGGNGVAILGSAKNNTISHSYIGTDILGHGLHGNGEAGVLIESGSSGNTIGSIDPAFVTLISSNASHGIELRGTHNNVIMSSKIGVELDGTTAAGNGGSGVYLSAGSYDNVIASAAGAPINIIANNVARGIFVESGSGNGIFGGSNYDNGSLGIDLAPGANLNQAAPVLGIVQTGSSSIQVTGTLNGTPKKKFTVEFFASVANSGDGENYLGSALVTTDASGLATFSVALPLPPSGADYITATATDGSNNTSEFSNAIL
ncbi:MAG: beta strand repeat-containing protein, partial [Pirellulales bacterium]